MSWICVIWAGSVLYELDLCYRPGLSLDWIQPAVVCLWGSSQHWTPLSSLRAGVRWCVVCDEWDAAVMGSTNHRLSSKLIYASVSFPFASCIHYKPSVTLTFSAMKNKKTSHFSCSLMFIFALNVSDSFFHSYSHMRKTISSSFCPQIHRDKDTLCSSVSQKRHSLSTGKITRLWPDIMLSVM